MFNGGFKTLASVASKSWVEDLVAAGLTSDITGDVTGSVSLPAVDAITATENMSDTDFASTSVTLDGTAACDISNWTPTIGKTYNIFATNVDNNPTLILSSGFTFDGSGATATFDAVGEFLQVICLTTALVKVIANPDSITIS